jgi:DNA phosphorothioation-associated putative methyltransferase
MKNGRISLAGVERLPADLQGLREIVLKLPFGKRVNTAVYVYRVETGHFGSELEALIRILSDRFSIGAEYNLLKFRTDEMKVSFLSYPEFFEVAHPELKGAITIDLVTGKSRRNDYRTQSNPPILHRKETFLPADHPDVATFRELTTAEEEAGLYKAISTIGFKLNWERLLKERRLEIHGHALHGLAEATNSNPEPTGPEIDRHKTAMKRYDLSKPIKGAIEHGLITKDATFFDYGCGLGTDIAALQAMGHPAEGWDPAHRPGVCKRNAQVVNLGYVLNVIEDPAERIETLSAAFRLAERLLIVSGLINRTVDESRAAKYEDGVVTMRNTFQKFFDQSELQQFIEDVLDTTAIPAGLGIFYVFRDIEDQQEFLFRRTRRAIDWTKMADRFGLGRPQPKTDHYEQHKELLDDFWRCTMELGRPPDLGEYEREAELRKTFGSPKTAHRLFISKFGQKELDAAAELRRNDLLVYLALAHLRKVPPFAQLPKRLQRDVRAFCGNYVAGLKEGRELLFAAGDPGEIELACGSVNVGLHDGQALYIHRSLLDSMPPILKVYVGCAAARYGDLNQTDIIKIHKASGKVTFLTYDDFDGKPLPELRQRIKVNLRNLFVQVFEYPESPDSQLLYFKERYLSQDYPEIERLRKFSKKLRKLGLTEEMGFGPTKAEFKVLSSSPHAASCPRP